MCPILICYTEIIDFILKLLSFNVYHIQIWRATWGVEITLPRFDLFMLSFLLTRNERKIFGPFPGHTWGHPVKSVPYVMTHQEITAVHHTYSLLSAEIRYCCSWYFKQKDQDAGFLFRTSKFFHPLSLRCSSLHLPAALQLSVLHTLTPSHQKSVQHQSVLPHGHIQVS